MEDLTNISIRVTTPEFNMSNESQNASLSSSSNFQEFVFNRRLLFNVIAYSIMFMIGTISNVSVFVAAFRRSRIGSSQFLRTNVHSMVLHLTVADLIVTIIVIPVEIFWRISVQWYIGDLSCKIFMFLRAFGFYLSSMTLVCLSLDRYIAISQPLATLEPRNNRRRGRIMLCFAWILSGFCALPQMVVFRVLKHPDHAFYQCTSMNFFAELYQSRNISHPFITTEQAQNLYSAFFLGVVYFIPLFVIIVTYTNVWRKVLEQPSSLTGGSTRRTPMRYTFSNRRLRGNSSSMIQLSTNNSSYRRSDAEKEFSRLNIQTRITSGNTETTDTYIELKTKGKESKRNRRKKSSENGVSSGSRYLTDNSNDCIRRNRRNSFTNSSQSSALKMSCIHVLAFVSCWTPYLIMSLWHIMDPETVKGVSSEVQDVLFLTAVLNSCINPLVYGSFYLRIFNRKNLRANDSMLRSR